MDLSRFQSWYGWSSSPIGFQSGHCFFFANWTASPIGPYSALAEFTPDGRRIIYADPPASAKWPCILHQFDEVHGARLAMEWPGSTRLAVSATRTDGEQISLGLQVAESVGCKLMVLLSRGTSPERLTPALLRWGDVLWHLLVSGGGDRSSGVTDKGRKYLPGGTDRVLRITGGQAQARGSSLGAIAKVERPPDLGDGGFPRRPSLSLVKVLFEITPAETALAEVSR